MKLLLISPQKVYATRRLIMEAAEQDITVTAVDVKELGGRNYQVDPGDFDALFIRQAYLEFARKVEPAQLQSLINLARQFRHADKVVVDQSIAEGDIGQGKYGALQVLRQQGIAVPQTNLLSNISADDISYPVIAKWNFGFGAKYTYLIHNSEELERVKQKYPADQILIQQFVSADFEYKVMTVGFKSLPAIVKIKTNQNKFLPDLKNFQIISTGDASAVAHLAEKSSRLSGCELAKTDILQAGDQLYVLEVNRWPGLRYFEAASKYNVAGAFLSYIKDKSA